MMKTIMKTKDNTEALGYAAYMMVGSYFKNCRVDSEIIESRLYISYKEAGDKLQYVMEDLAERYAKENIFNKLPEKAFCQSVAVSFQRKSESSMVVTFKSRDFIIRMECSYVNRICIFNHKLYVRKGKNDCLRAA